jgi:E3 ubiquitin-protein ligase MYCBP2
LMKLAMAKYNFYQCSTCKRPYYGGVAACGAIEQGPDVGAQEGGGHGGKGGALQGGGEDLMCGSCSAKASGIKGAVCTRHDESYIEFKCRFCCSIATFFCFGHTHFCEKCHLNWVQGASRHDMNLF